jgi:hypothetical protein
LETYYIKDENKAKITLLRKISDFDDCTCMQIAVASNCLSVIAHPCFQNIIIKKWYNLIMPDVSKKQVNIVFTNFW